MLQNDFKFLKALLSQKPVQFTQILGYLNSTLKPTLVQTFSRIKVYMHWLFPFLHMEVKF